MIFEHEDSLIPNNLLPLQLTLLVLKYYFFLELSFSQTLRPIRRREHGLKIDTRGTESAESHVTQPSQPSLTRAINLTKKAFYNRIRLTRPSRNGTRLTRAQTWSSRNGTCQFSFRRGTGTRLDFVKTKFKSNRSSFKTLIERASVGEKGIINHRRSI